MQEINSLQIAENARATAKVFASRAGAIRDSVQQMLTACATEGTVGYNSREMLWEKAEEFTVLANALEQMALQLLGAADQMEKAIESGQALAEFKAYLVFVEDQLRQEENNAENVLKTLQRSI